MEGRLAGGGSERRAGGLAGLKNWRHQGVPPRIDSRIILQVSNLPDLEFAGVSIPIDKVHYSYRDRAAKVLCCLVLVSLYGLGSGISTRLSPRKFPPNGVACGVGPSSRIASSSAWFGLRPTLIRSSPDWTNCESAPEPLLDSIPESLSAPRIASLIANARSRWETKVWKVRSGVLLIPGPMEMPSRISSLWRSAAGSLVNGQCSTDRTNAIFSAIACGSFSSTYSMRTVIGGSFDNFTIGVNPWSETGGKLTGCRWL